MQRQATKATNTLQQVGILIKIILVSIFAPSHPILAQHACVITDTGTKVCGRLVIDNNGRAASEPKSFQIEPYDSKSIRFSLLLGEWSKSGQCSTERFIYTENSKYIWMQKKGSTWNISYRGIYVPKPELNSVFIADGPNMGGYVVNIYELNQTIYRGAWNTELSEGLSFDNPEDAKFTYVRCSGTSLKRD
jgi:hypothetical protein